MLINFPNPSTLVIQGGEEVSEFRETLTVRSPGYQFTQAYKKGHWDGKVRPGKFSVKGNKSKLIISRGVLNKLREFLRDQGLPKPKYRLGYDPVSKPDIHEKISDEVWDKLRDYQRQSLKDIINNRWGRIALATNAGKGAVIALTAQVLVPHKTLILSDEISVFQALEAELEQWTDEDVEIVKSGMTNPPNSNVVLGMLPTIAKRIGKNSEHKEVWDAWLKDFTCVLVDEADRATSKSWQRVLWTMKNTEFRVGFSGSFPEKNTLDDVNLEQNIGPELIAVKNMELVNRGISAKPMVHLYPFRTQDYRLQQEVDEIKSELEYKFGDVDVVPSSSDSTKLDIYGDPNRLDFVFKECKNYSGFRVQDKNLGGDRWIRFSPNNHKVYDYYVVDNEKHNEFIKSLLKDGQNAIIVDYKKHGRILEDMIPDSVFLDGDDSDKKRIEVLNSFMNKEFTNLIATSILDRGSNMLGIVDCLLLISGSVKQVLQRVGRGLRKGEMKEQVVIKDIQNQSHEYLLNASQRRVKVYEDEGFDITWEAT